MDLKHFQGKNYYQLLGIAEDASVDEIKAVYRDMARVFHPDSNFFDEIAPDKPSDEQLQIFKIITAAYNTLIDPKKRGEYDDQLNPLRNLKLKGWESNDDFWLRQEASKKTAELVPAGPKAKSRKRQPSGSFGRTEFIRPGWEKTVDEEANDQSEMLSMSQIIHINPVKTKGWFVFGLSVGLALVVVTATAYMLFVKFG